MGNTHRQKMRIFWLTLFCAALGGLLIAGCTPQKAYLVYVQKADYLAQEDIYLYQIPVPPNSSTVVPLATSPDPELPCGATSDGRIVYTRVTAQGGDIYAVKADGSGSTAIITTPKDERCKYVTSNGQVIYQVRSGTLAGDDIWTVTVGAGVIYANYSLADDPQIDEHFLAMAPDQSVIFARAPGVQGGYDLYSHPMWAGRCAGYWSLWGCLLAFRVFDKPGFPYGSFHGVTPDNHVIYSNIGGSYMGSLWEIYSVKTDGTGGMRIAANPFNDQFSTGHEQIFCALDDNRVVFTDRRSNYLGRGYGDIYVVGADGSGRTLLHAILADNFCNGITSDHYVIFTRRLGSGPFNAGQDELLSIKADGNSQEVLLAAAPSNATNHFEAITPLSQIIFYSSSCTGLTCTGSLNSIATDGSGLATLPCSGGVEAVADPAIGYETIICAQIPPGSTSNNQNLFVVPLAGGAPVQIASSPDFQSVRFVFYR